MQTSDIYPHQRLELEFRVENVGTSSIKVPIHPKLRDLQPSNAVTQFEYYSLRLPLEARVPGKGLLVGWLELYGSPTLPDTILTLHPGEWIRVKGDIIVQRSYASEHTGTASTDFWLSRNVFPAEPDNTATPSVQDCILQVAGRSITAHFHSEQSH